MISNKVQKMYEEERRKREIQNICRESRNPRRGELFRRFETAEGITSSDILPADTKICCVGPASEEELLFRTVDGRYYFSLLDGWGVKGDTLYGLELGMNFDFGHPTTRKSLAAECRKVLENYHPNSWASAMKYHSTKSDIETILEVEECEAAQAAAKNREV